jgi:hypothetical protein
MEYPFRLWIDPDIEFHAAVRQKFCCGADIPEVHINRHCFYTAFPRFRIRSLIKINRIGDAAMRQTLKGKRLVGGQIPQRFEAQKRESLALALGGRDTGAAEPLPPPGDHVAVVDNVRYARTP